MCILDGNAYDAKCLEAGQERDEDLDACSLLVNNKTQPLLLPSGAAAHNAAHKVVVQLTVRAASLLGGMHRPSLRLRLDLGRSGLCLV